MLTYGKGRQEKKCVLNAYTVLVRLTNSPSSVCLYEVRASASLSSTMYT